MAALSTVPAVSDVAPLGTHHATSKVVATIAATPVAHFQDRAAVHTVPISRIGGAKIAAMTKLAAASAVVLFYTTPHCATPIPPRIISHSITLRIQRLL